MTHAEQHPPTHLITPDVGTALVFGGNVTHAAQPILSGERIVFVASFSPLADYGNCDFRTQAPRVAVQECSLDDFCLALENG